VPDDYEEEDDSDDEDDGEIDEEMEEQLHNFVAALQVLLFDFMRS
jgi:hypothetical protein